MVRKIPTVVAGVGRGGALTKRRQKEHSGVTKISVS